MDKELQPALHKTLIREGKMTEQESQRQVEDWKLKNMIEETTGETIDDMRLEEELEDWAEMHGAYQDDDGEWQV